MNTSCNGLRSVDDSRGLLETSNCKPTEFKLEVIDHTDYGLQHAVNLKYFDPDTSQIGVNSDVLENSNKNGFITDMGEICTNNSKEFAATTLYSGNECKQNFRHDNQRNRCENVESIPVNSPHSHRHLGLSSDQTEETKPSFDTFSLSSVRDNSAHEALHLKHYSVDDRLTILNVPKIEDQDARMDLTDVVTRISNDYTSYDVIDSDALCVSLPSRVQSSISSEEFNAICRFVGDSTATVSATTVTSIAEESNEHRSTVASFKCDSCPREFLTEKYLHMHKSLHITPGKTLFSSGGSETESSVTLVSVHRRQSTDTDDQLQQLPPAAKLLKLDFNGTQWSCNICKKTFAQNSNYKNHVRTHSNERPFICDVCSIGFKERYHLKKHILFKHTDEMKEECRVCGKRFKDSTAVRAHERIHSDARPYGCRRCGKTFKTSECLWHHENRSRTCGNIMDGTSQLVCPIQTAKHGVQRHVGRKLELAAAFGTGGYSRGRGVGHNLEQNQRNFTPSSHDNLVDVMSPMTTHIKMEELDPPTGSCDDFSENYLNALSMSSGLAFYEFRDIDAPPPMTSSDITPRGDYDEIGSAAKRSAVGDDRKMCRQLVGPHSPITRTRKLTKSGISSSSSTTNDSTLNIPGTKNSVAELNYTGSGSTNLDFVQTEEPLETEHDKIMRFISEYDGGNRSANDTSKRINENGTAASLSPPTAAVFPTWQQHKNPSLRDAAQVAKSVMSEDHRFCYGNLSNLPTAVVAPIQREASLASSSSANTPFVSSCTDSIPLTVSNANFNTNFEQKNSLPPFETFAPIMRSTANFNQVGYRLQNIPPPLQQPTRYREPAQAQQVKPRLQMTSMLPVTRPEFIYRQRQPLRFAMMPKCEPSAADECPTLQKYLLNNNITGYQQKNSMHPTACAYLPVQAVNTPQMPVLKSRGTVAATEVTHFNGYPINSAKINPSTYLYSDSQWGRFPAPEVEDMKVDCGTIYGATNEIWYVDNAEHHLIQKVYAGNLPGEATAQVYAMNLSGAVIAPIGNEIGRRNQMI